MLTLISVKRIRKKFRRCVAVSTAIKEKTAITLKDERTIYFREPTEDDGSEMFRIVKESKVLDVNSSYSYLMWSKYFNKTSIIAESEDNEVIGFVSGFIQPDSPDTLFVWQVAVAKNHRSKGLATKLIEQLLNQLEKEKVNYLEATVTPSNIPSSNLFKGIAKKNNTNCTIFECFSEDQFPDPSHEPEMTYRIGPLK